MYSKKISSRNRINIAAISIGLLTCLFLASSLFSAPALGGRTEKSIDQKFDVAYGGTLYLDSDLGSVKVTSHSAKQVKVKVILIANTKNESKAEEWFKEFELSFEKSGRDVNIYGKRDQGLFRNWRRKIKVHFELVVPEKYNLDIETSDGRIEVADISGEVKLHTSGGGIRMGEIDGDVVATTSGGGILLERANGSARVKTSGGRITIGEVKGDVDAKTSGGGINVDGVDGDLIASSSGGGLNLRRVNGNLKASTSGGPITAELLKQIERDVELRTSGGGIRLDVPDDLQADINASTSGGSVSSDLPVTVRGKFERSSLRGKLNGGGPELFLRSSGGSIFIE